MDHKIKQKNKNKAWKQVTLVHWRFWVVSEPDRD